LSIIMIQMIVAVFPFVIVDLYWQTPHYRRVYLSWLLPVSVNMIHTYAALLIGPFRSLSIDNAYAVMLLTFAAIVFFFLSRKIIPPRTQENPAAGSPPDINDIFRKHNLSERETEVAMLLAHEGLSYEEMGNRLFISERTIKFHVSNIFQKFGVIKRVAFLAKLNKQS
ncbi:MAG: LuxR C-terminal-related transcriptional regulator, partial [Treponema sp.]|nr:LuxR C-terminal-related transcriptional regulator [Treponema sp.]